MFSYTAHVMRVIREKNSSKSYDAKRIFTLWYTCRSFRLTSDANPRFIGNPIKITSACLTSVPVWKYMCHIQTLVFDQMKRRKNYHNYQYKLCQILNW